MRSSTKQVIVTFLSISLLIVFASQYVISYPGQTTECDACHNTQGVLTLTSNATGTVEVELGGSFSLLLDSTGYTGGDNNYIISLQAGWEDNNQFTFTPTEVEDGGTGDLDSSTNEIQALFPFTANNAGSFTIRFWVAAAGDLATSLDVSVSVLVPAGSPPVIDSPADIEYDLGDTGNSIVWTPSDDNPSSYEIFLDSISVRTGAWNTSGETISIVVDGHTLGTYNYTLQVIDGDTLSASDTVFVTVNDPIPIVSSPSDITYMEGGTGYSRTWTATDNNPSSYTLWLDGAILKTGPWNSSGESLVVNVDGLSVEVHNYTVMFTDLNDGNGTDTVLVRVNSYTLPTTNHPPDIIQAEGGSVYLSWDAHDLNPDAYIIYLNDSSEKSGQWNSASQALFINKGGLGLGTFNFTIWVIDDDLNTATDTVWVTIYDGTAPVPGSPLDIEYDEGDLGTYTVSWTPYDKYPDTYEVLKDGVTIKSGDWNTSSDVISVDASGLSGGVYNYTLIVTDVGLNIGIDTVLVTVNDITPPTVDDVEDFAYVEGTTGHSIVWSPYDQNPTSYEVYLETSLYKEGLWNSSSETIIVGIDGLQEGIHNFTIYVFDVSDNNASDYVLVSVNDETVPLIDNPADIEFSSGETGNIITWTATDLHLESYTIYLNGTEDDTYTLGSSPATIQYDVDDLSEGVHNVTVLVQDESGNSASDEVIVIVMPATSSTTTTTTTTETSTTTTDSTTGSTDTTDGPEPVNPTLQNYINTVYITWIASIIAIIVGSEVYRRKYGD
ncbi:MAG: hypothetical protein ACFFED_07825 [Candidatus Thorarchaeota archaeon]